MALHLALHQCYQEFAISYSGVCPININLHFFLDGCAFTFGGARGSAVGPASAHTGHMGYTWGTQCALILTHHFPEHRRMAHHLWTIQRRDAAPLRRDRVLRRDRSRRAAPWPLPRRACPHLRAATAQQSPAPRGGPRRGPSPSPASEAGSPRDHPLPEAKARPQPRVITAARARRPFIV